MTQHPLKRKTWGDTLTMILFWCCGFGCWVHEWKWVELLEMQERSQTSLCKQQSSGSMNWAGP